MGLLIILRLALYKASTYTAILSLWPYSSVNDKVCSYHNPSLHPLPRVSTFLHHYLSFAYSPQTHLNSNFSFPIVVASYQRLVSSSHTLLTLGIYYTPIMILYISHMKEIIVFVPLLLISLSIRPSRSSTIAANSMNSSLFMAE